jgi:hypothetical protein
MPMIKVALTRDAALIEQVDDLVARRRFSESQPRGRGALADKLRRLARTRLAREAAKMNPAEEKRLGRASEEELARVVDGLNEIVG